MTSNTVLFMFNRFIKIAFLAFILYLIFTNFGTFLLIVAGFFIAVAGFVFFLKQKFKKSGFQFQFNTKDFEQQFKNGAFRNGNTNFNFNDFNNFNNSNFNGGFNQYQNISEQSSAKQFFGFSHEPTKEEVKKRYKELARKYHPDINGGDDTKMKQLNHYKDVLLSMFS